MYSEHSWYLSCMFHSIAFKSMYVFEYSHTHSLINIKVVFLFRRKYQ